MVELDTFLEHGKRRANSEKWDKYFYDVAYAVAQNSKCLSRKIGAVIVRGKSIIATGYNGPPSGVKHCADRWGLYDENDPIYHGANPDGIAAPQIDDNICPRQTFGYQSGEGTFMCPAGHAERNAIANAAKMGVSTIGATMYMTCPTPCKDCLADIIGAGISEIVMTKHFVYDDMSQYILNGAHLKVRIFSHLGE